MPWLVANNRHIEAVESLRKMAEKDSDIEAINDLLLDINMYDEDVHENTKMDEINGKPDPIYKEPKHKISSGLLPKKGIPNAETTEKKKDLSSVYNLLRNRWAFCSPRRKSRTAYSWGNLFRNKVLLFNLAISGFVWYVFSYNTILTK